MKFELCGAGGMELGESCMYTCVYRSIILGFLRTENCTKRGE